MLKYLCILILMFITSCNKSVQLRNSVYIPYLMSSTPDPLHILYSGDWILTNHLWSSLVDLKYDGTIEPILAKSWSRSIDGKSWTIKLKDNLKWSDGSNMTAEEIVNSLAVSQKGTSHTDLSKSIESIKVIDSSTILFRLKMVVPQFLEGLTYSDWSIIHADSISLKDGKNYISKYQKLSGPYTFKNEAHIKSGVVPYVSLVKNLNHPLQAGVIFPNGKIATYQRCEELINHSSEIASFRMYRDDLTPECEKKLKEKGFEFIPSQPSWIVKADFSNHALKSINLEQRKSILIALQHILKKEFSDIGNSRATGLRASYLYGSLPEVEFDALLEKSSQKLPVMQKHKLRIVSMDIWSTWKSYHWLVSTLQKMGHDVIESKLSMTEFYSQFAAGKIQTDYELIFVPLGVGDIDPDGSWRIASRYFYSDVISSESLHQAYLELDHDKRNTLYKNFAKNLIESARYIPLVMNSDIIGVHQDFKVKEGTALRNGTSLYDIE